MISRCTYIKKLILALVSYINLAVLTGWIQNGVPESFNQLTQLAQASNHGRISACQSNRCGGDITATVIRWVSMHLEFVKLPCYIPPQDHYFFHSRYRVRLSFLSAPGKVFFLQLPRSCFLHNYTSYTVNLYCNYSRFILRHYSS